MGADTRIEWADHSFNAWTGCTRVSPGCDNCYAAAQAKRNPSTFGSWEPGGARKRTSAAYWDQPRRWNAKAEREGRRVRVFCASMADVFDSKADPAWREDLWALIHDTPHLDWLLLTKRPQNIAKMLPGSDGRGPSDYSRGVWGEGWPNVWLGTTAENQAEAERRIPHLLAVPAAKRFLSCEPLLGPVDLKPWFRNDYPSGYYLSGNGIHWVITGGESGPNARPSNPQWFRDLRDQCATAGVPFFFKQWGEWFPAELEDTGEGRMQMSPDVDHDPQADRWEFSPKPHRRLSDGTGMGRIGKQHTGRLLDGREHNEVPA